MILSGSECTLKNRFSWRGFSVTELHVSREKRLAINTRNRLPAIAASFSIRKTSKAEPFSYAMFGSTSLPTLRAWNSRSRLMVGRPGK